MNEQEKLDAILRNEEKLDTLLRSVNNIRKCLLAIACMALGFVIPLPYVNVLVIAAGLIGFLCYAFEKIDTPPPKKKPKSTAEDTP